MRLLRASLEVAGSAIDQTEVLVQIAFQSAGSANLSRFPRPRHTRRPNPDFGGSQCKATAYPPVL
jgi:hypothetical protein